MYNNQASRTALKVAMSIITLGEKPGMDGVLPPGTVEATANLLIASGAVEENTVRWSRSQLMVSVYEMFDWVMPGQFEAFGHRKAFCERTVKRGISAGATQVLVLGAGYDTMAWRLAPEFPDIRFFEIDHPATACLKAKGIEFMGQRTNLCLIAEDLGGRKLVDTLETSKSWHQNACTIIIAEGLLMYLTPASVDDLFCQSAKVTGPGSRIAFSYIPSRTDGRPDVGRWSALMLWLQEIVGEPWVWSIRPEELGSYLKALGWLYEGATQGDPCKQGVEYFAVAEK